VTALLFPHANHVRIASGALTMARISNLLAAASLPSPPKLQQSRSATGQRIMLTG
jgi:hypothetical protein